MEQNFEPNTDLNQAIEKERRESYKYGARTVYGTAKKSKDDQLNLFEI